MKKILYVTYFSVFIFIQACFENPPTMQDGNSNIKLLALWNNDLSNLTENLIPLKNAEVIISSEYGIQIKYTDENGWLILSNLPSSTYSFSFRLEYPEDKNIILMGSILSIQLKPKQEIIDTVDARPYSNNGMAINEMYYVGPVNNIFYFSDQFVELYNAGDSVKYLDGLMIMRFSGNTEEGHKGPGADENNDGNLEGVSNIFKFPGNPGEVNYPFYPKSFLVIAADAINHKNIIAGSLDLSNADWEFYNQFSADDIDNPSIPNLISIRSDIVSDFNMNLNSDIILMTKGNDKVWEDGINISDIIDGVEYKSSYSQIKTLDARIDRGVVIGPTRFNGKSIQRRDPGTDSNNSSLDNSPTPGHP
jgi:hypothetical protein